LSTLNIRAFKAADIDAISGWLDSSRNNPWSANTIIEVLEKKHYRLLVSEQASVVNGLCLFTLVADECNLLYIAVDAQYRKQGIGRQLLNALLNQSRQHNISRVFLEVRNSNQAAIALYKAAGFIQSAERKNYYPVLESSLVNPLDDANNQRETALLFDLSFKEKNE
jgi:ribosomal-protein-alanine N-acetyltransferase